MKKNLIFGGNILYISIGNEENNFNMDVCVNFSELFDKDSLNDILEKDLKVELDIGDNTFNGTIAGWHNEHLDVHFSVVINITDSKEASYLNSLIDNTVGKLPHVWMRLKYE